jgi:hypothetical protein
VFGLGGMATCLLLAIGPQLSGDVGHIFSSGLRISHLAQCPERVFGKIGPEADVAIDSVAEHVSEYGVKCSYELKLTLFELVQVGLVKPGRNTLMSCFECLTGRYVKAPFFWRHAEFVSSESIKVPHFGAEIVRLSIPPKAQSWRIAGVDDLKFIAGFVTVIDPIHVNFRHSNTRFRNCDVSPNLGLANASSIFCNLVHLYNGLSQTPSLYPEHNRLYRANYYQKRGELYDPPVGRRLLVSFALVLFGFLLALRGGNDLDRKRPGRGATQTAIGFLMIAAGFWLLLIFDWPETYGWWL